MRAEIVKNDRGVRFFHIYHDNGTLVHRFEFLKGILNYVNGLLENLDKYNNLVSEVLKLRADTQNLKDIIEEYEFSRGITLETLEQTRTHNEHLAGLLGERDKSIEQYQKRHEVDTTLINNNINEYDLIFTRKNRDIDSLQNTVRTLRASIVEKCALIQSSHNKIVDLEKENFELRDVIAGIRKPIEIDTKAELHSKLLHEANLRLVTENNKLNDELNTLYEACKIAVKVNLNLVKKNKLPWWKLVLGQS